MTASCPRCGNNELRVHGSRCHVSWEKRWRWTGPLVPRYRPVASEVSCAACLYAFVVWPERIEPAPTQQAHDMLAEALKQARQAAVEPPEPKKATPQARPAPDPRTRRR